MYLVLENKILIIFSEIIIRMILLYVNIKDESLNFMSLINLITLISSTILIVDNKLPIRNKGRG